MPPSRYRVVEQGRRLVVVDTRTGQPASSSAPRPVGPDRNAARMAASASSAAGNPTFVTSRLFDNKAPRTVVLDQYNSRRAGSGMGLAILTVTFLGSLAWLVPELLIVIAILLGTGGVRRVLRAGITKWIDGLVHDAGSSRA